MKLYMFFIIFLLNSILYSQTEGVKALNNAFLAENSKAMFDNNKVLINLKEVAGSPYLSEDFKSGTVFVETSRESLGYQMRYNIYNDEIEIRNSESNSIVSLKKNSNYSCEITNKVFKYIDYTDINYENRQGYFQELKKGKKALFLKYECKFQPKEIGKPPMFKVTAAKFVILKTYYLYSQGKINPINLKKKKFLETFGSHKSNVNSFMNNNKLKANREADLIRIITYYNSLLE